MTTQALYSSPDEKYNDSSMDINYIYIYMCESITNVIVLSGVSTTRD